MVLADLDTFLIRATHVPNQVSTRNKASAPTSFESDLPCGNRRLGEFSSGTLKDDASLRNIFIEFLSLFRKDPIEFPADKEILFAFFGLIG
uniref:Uncharacterized protein n=1 Tax=Panagrolaimus sp. PS1159 TaxID=55785 RepID=A0AC35FVI5_9BILA